DLLQATQADSDVVLLAKEGIEAAVEHLAGQALQAATLGRIERVRAGQHEVRYSGRCLECVEALLEWRVRPQVGQPGTLLVEPRGQPVHGTKRRQIGMAVEQHGGEKDEATAGQGENAAPVGRAGQNDPVDKLDASL